MIHFRSDCPIQSQHYYRTVVSAFAYLPWFVLGKVNNAESYSNTVVSNHFHSVKSLLFSSARPRDFDGMLGTRLPVSIYTTKSPIDMRRFNVPELDELLIFSVKDRYQLNYFICIKDFNAQTITSLIKFAFFVYLLMSAP